MREHHSGSIIADAPLSGRQRLGRPGRPLSDATFGVILVLPAMALFVAVILYPLLNSLVMAFFDQSLVRPDRTFVGLANIQAVLSDNFLALLRTTVVFALFSTLIPFLIGLALALILNIPFRGRSLLRGAILLPWLLPGVIVSFLWMWIFNANYGVLNGALQLSGLIHQNINWLGQPSTALIGVITAKTWNSFPWLTVMLLAGLQAINQDLYEAAAIDGAGRWQCFWRITLPQLRGVISIVLLLELIWNFQHFETIYVLTSGGPAGATTTFAVAVYETAFQAFDLGKASAIGLLWMVLLSVLVLVYLRFERQEDAE